MLLSGRRTSKINMVVNSSIRTKRKNNIYFSGRIFFSTSLRFDVAEKNCTTTRNFIKHEKEYRVVLLKYRRIANGTHFAKKTLMSHQTAILLHTLPVQMVYRILDNLDNKTIFMSCGGVCQRLNAIIDTYKPYQVIFHFISS